MRKSNFDNIKGVMIFFVVWGHILEFNMFGISKSVYVLIYSFHMPVFAVISGYFAKFKPTSIIKRNLLPYLLLQTIELLLERNNSDLQFTTPCWTLWYLLALAVWKGLIPFIENESEVKRSIILSFSVTMGLLVGFDDTVGYYLSVSRIVVFFPYFVFGYYSGQGFFKSIKLYKAYKNISPRLCIAFMIVLSIVILITADYVTYECLWGSYSYNSLNYGPIHRLAFYLCGIVWTVLILRAAPNVNSFVAFIGRHSMAIYTGHSIIIKMLEDKLNELKISNDAAFAIVAFILSAAIVAVIVGVERTINIMYNKFKNMQERRAVLDKG